MESPILIIVIFIVWVAVNRWILPLFGIYT